MGPWRWNKRHSYIFAGILRVSVPQAQPGGERLSDTAPSKGTPRPTIEISLVFKVFFSNTFSNGVLVPYDLNQSNYGHDLDKKRV